MVWVRLADDFTDHPKVISAGPLAGWLYVCGLTYANRYLTDGFIPTGQVRRLADVEDATHLAGKLVSVGLWEVAEGGYQIHDYHIYQPSADDVKRERQATADRVAEYRRRRAEQRNGSGNASGNGVTNAERTGAPARPGPDPAGINPDPAGTPTPNPFPTGEGEHPPPAPPASGRGAAGRRRRNGSGDSGPNGHAPGANGVTSKNSAAALAPLAENDERRWEAALAEMRPYVRPPMFDALIRPLVPIGRAANGGLYLRAPPGRGGECQRIADVVRRALRDAGDEAGVHAAIVET